MYLYTLYVPVTSVIKIVILFPGHGVIHVARES